MFTIDKDLFLLGKHYKFHKLTEEDFNRPATLKRLEVYATFVELHPVTHKQVKTFIFKHSDILSKRTIGDWIVCDATDYLDKWAPAPYELYIALEDTTDTDELYRQYSINDMENNDD